jgi:hypothetical protein
LCPSFVILADNAILLKTTRKCGNTMKLALLTIGILCLCFLGLSLSIFFKGKSISGKCSSASSDCACERAGKEKGSCHKSE